MSKIKNLIATSMVTCLILISVANVFAESSPNVSTSNSPIITEAVVSPDAISPNPPPVGYTGWSTVTADLLNMRQDPDYNSPIMVQIPYGSSVYVCPDDREDSTWAHVQYEGTDSWYVGYVARAYLEI